MREVVEIEMPHSTFTLYKSVEEQSQASEHTNCSPYTSILGKMPKLTKSVKLHLSGRARGRCRNFPSLKRLSSHHPCTPYFSKGGKSVKLNLNDTSITGTMEPKCMYILSNLPCKLSSTSETREWISSWQECFIRGVVNFWT